MIEQRHRIKRQILEIRAPNPEQARDLQAELRQVHGQRIAPLVDRVCSELSSPDRVHRIESLTLDLGTIDTHKFADSYMAALEHALRRVLAEEIRKSERADSERDQNLLVHSHIDLIELYALTGTLPWWANTSLNDVPRASVQALLDSAPHALVRLVRELVSEPAAVWRLVHSLDEAMITDLVRLLDPRTGRKRVELACELLDLLRSSCPIANIPANHWRHLLWQHILRVAALSAFGNPDFQSANSDPTKRDTQYFSQTLPSDAGSTFDPNTLVNNALVQMALDLGVTYRGLIAKLYEYVETHTQRISSSLRDAIGKAYRALADSSTNLASSADNPPIAHQEQRGSMRRLYDAPDSDIQTHGETTESRTASLAHLLAALRAQAHQPAAAVKPDEQRLASPSVADLGSVNSQQDEKALAQLLAAFETLADRGDASESLSISPDRGDNTETSITIADLEAALSSLESSQQNTEALTRLRAAFEALTNRSDGGESHSISRGRGVGPDTSVTVSDLEAALSSSEPSQQNTEALASLRAAFEALTNRGKGGEIISISHDQSVESAFEIDADAASDSDFVTDIHADTETDVESVATAIETEASDVILTDGLDNTSAPMSIGASSDLERLLERAMAQGIVTPELLQKCMAALNSYGANDPITRLRSELQRILQQTVARAHVALPRERLAASQRKETTPRAVSNIRRTRPIPSWSQRPHQRRLSNVEEIYVANSGLVILWPYLDRFLTRTGLLEDKQFIDQAAVQRAVGLLQYLANPNDFEADEPPEYILPLNKVLCGMEIDEVFAFGPPLSATEIEECDGLLTVAIHNAPILRDMSLQGFRGTFLLREGVLRSRDGAWLLNVERQTYDIVLDRFPWSWTWVKLPWMQAPLRVEW